MTTEPENLVLEHLRHIRNAVDGMRVELREVRDRVTLVEKGVTLIGGRLDIQTEHIARLDVRLDRIEARLGLVEA